MPDEPENIMLIYLRRLDAKMDRQSEDIGDLKQRMTTLEIQVGNLVATEQNHYASLASRLDRMDGRLERLERHADLIQAPIP